MTNSRKQEEVHATDTPASNTSGVLVDKDKKAHAVLDIGAKRRVLGSLVNGDDVARFTGNSEKGEAETRAIGVASFAAVEGIALGILEDDNVLVRFGNKFLGRNDTERGAWAGDCFGFGGNYGLRLWDMGELACKWKRRLEGEKRITIVGPEDVDVVVGRGPRRQEHPLEILVAGEELTYDGKDTVSMS